MSGAGNQNQNNQILGGLGVIQTCPHCNGSGICKRGDSGKACAGCNRHAGLTPNGKYVDNNGDLRNNHSDILCSACNGQGKVYIGPPNITIKP